MAMLKRRPGVSHGISGKSLVGSIGAEQLLAIAHENGVSGRPLDIERLALMIGLDVRYEPLESSISGSLRRANNGYVVTVNSLHHPNRQRFTLAHEVGHYCMHRSQQDEFQDEVFFRDETRSQIEMEANRFAADLLMPEDEFRSFIRLESSKVEDLADRFGVSSLAVRYRAKQLGFSGHGL